jgi:hypothetical protein
VAGDAGGWKPDDVLDLHLQSQARECSTYSKWLVQPQERFTQAPECVGAFPFGRSALKTRVPLLSLRRLPQLNAISVRIHDPGEAPVIIIFTVRIDLHTFFFQCLQQSI